MTTPRPPNAETTPESTPGCPLCVSLSSSFHDDRRRSYLRCLVCRLVFVRAEEFVPTDVERSIYELHENSPGDAGYRRFLSRMLEPIVRRVPAGGSGLDFGCGPGPALSIMLEERGYRVALYDRFFATDETALENTYDFVTATEVAEHLRHPRETLESMWRCVKPGGYLGIMTKMVTDQDAFERWHYKDDETHICFFSLETFGWLARLWRTEAEFEGKDVVLFRKGRTIGLVQSVSLS